VIAADPAAGRKGLGTALTLAGLDHLHRRGLGIGMLYVDGGNAQGLAMYDRLGFAVHHTDVAWTIEVAP
jgi:mycothiol synthase